MLNHLRQLENAFASTTDPSSLNSAATRPIAFRDQADSARLSHLIGFGPSMMANDSSSIHQLRSQAAGKATNAHASLPESSGSARLHGPERCSSFRPVACAKLPQNVPHMRLDGRLSHQHPFRYLAIPCTAADAA